MDMLLEQFKTIFDRPEKIKKLRETILDLAVRGKLVQQDPNDEPASVLFQKIKNEKERLIKEKKIKKEKQLAEISEDEKPFELPTGWEFVRIGDLGNIFNGNSINAKIKETVYANVEEGYNYISTKDVAFDGKGIDYNTGVKVPYNEKKFKVAHNGSVLICSEGGSAGRKIGLTDKDICFGNKLYAIEPIKGVLSEYIFYLYQSPMFFDLFASKMTGIIGGISIANFKEIIIPLCTLNEQKRIVEKVDSLMEFCDKLEKALEKKVHYGELSAKSVFNALGNISDTEELEETFKFILLNFNDLSLGDNAVKELKNCILQLAVQGKLVSQEPNDESANVLLEKIREEKERLIKEKKIKKEKPLAEINQEEKFLELPKQWSWARIGTIFTTTSGSTPSRGRNDFYNDATINWVKTRDLNNSLVIRCEEKISETAYRECKLLVLPRYTVCIAMYGGAGTIGKCGVLGIETTINQSVCGILPNKQYNYKFLYYFILYIRPYWMNYASGSRVDPNINRNIIKNMLIPVPPFEEQNRIVERVDSLMELCDELEKKIEKQKEYSSRLMEVVIKNI